MTSHYSSFLGCNIHFAASKKRRNSRLLLLDDGDVDGMCTSSSKAYCSVHLVHAEREFKVNKYQLSDGMSRLGHVGLKTVTSTAEPIESAALLRDSQY